MSDNLWPISLPSGITPQYFGSGGSHVGIISSIGQLFMWGYNINGQLVRKDILFKCYCFITIGT